MRISDWSSYVCSSDLMFETEGDLRITAELPGVDPKDVEVTLEDDLLTLRGEKRSEQEDKRQSYHVSERSYGSFVRTVRLPFEPEADKVNASLDRKSTRLNSSH